MNKLKNFDEYVNEYSSFRKREMNAGLEDEDGLGGNHYETEEGGMVWVDEYDEEEHGKRLGLYNSKGKKIASFKNNKRI